MRDMHRNEKTLDILEGFARNQQKQKKEASLLSYPEECWSENTELRDEYHLKSQS